MMRSIAGLALAVSMLAFALSAQARKQSVQNVDFGEIDCATFLQDIASGTEDDAASVMLWLDGYLSGVSGDTVLRFDGLESFATGLVEYCAENGSKPLLDAARTVGIQ